MRSAADTFASSIMRLHAANPTSGLSVLAAHSPRSVGVAASAGIASKRPMQRSSPPDPRAAMLFPFAWRSDAKRPDVRTLAPTAGHPPSTIDVRDAPKPEWRVMGLGFVPPSDL